MWASKLISVLLILISFTVKADCAWTAPPSPKPIQAPELFIFVSFSMPEQSLKLWATEANRVDGKLRLRGFLDNSVPKTTAKIVAIFGEEPNVDMAIDPERFQNFNIQMVPAVVIAQPALEENDAPPHFDVVYGDTSLEEALIRISKTGSPEGQKTAKAFLKNYREFHE